MVVCDVCILITGVHTRQLCTLLYQGTHLSDEATKLEMSTEQNVLSTKQLQIYIHVCSKIENE